MKKISLIALIGLLALGSVSPVLARGENMEKNEAYRKAKQEFEAAREEFKKSREDFQNKRQEIQKDVKNDRVQEKGKIFLERIIQDMIKKLDNAKLWVENRKEVSDVDKKLALAEIEKELVWLKQQQAKVAGLSQEQVRELAKEIRTRVQVNHKKVKGMLGNVINKHVTRSVERIQNVVTKVENRVKALKAEGKNVSAYETQIVAVKAKVTLAQEKFASAKKSYAAVDASKNAEEQFRSAQALVKEGNEALRSALKDIKGVLEGLKKEFGATVVLEEKKV